MRALEQKLRELARRPGLSISYVASGSIYITYVEDVRLKTELGRALWLLEVRSLEPDITVRHYPTAELGELRCFNPRPRVRGDRFNLNHSRAL